MLGCIFDNNRGHMQACRHRQPQPEHGRLQQQRNVCCTTTHRPRGWINPRPMVCSVLGPRTWTYAVSHAFAPLSTFAHGTPSASSCRRQAGIACTETPLVQHSLLLPALHTGGMRSNKRSRVTKGDGKGAGGGSAGSSSEDDVAVVKADKRGKKGVNNFSTGGGSGGAEARAAARWARRPLA